jgi:putative nucleotidyltransferase with HDIG domain
MESTATEKDGVANQANVRKYFREVVENHKLPSLPVVAGKVLEMIQDPDVNVQKLCRVLADDMALASRVLAVSRSPLYAQRNPPKTLDAAVHVLGFRTLNSVVVANATHSLCVKGNKTSERLWNHSLAVALAMRTLSNRAGYRDGDQAFTGGLMHDVGEMILLHGDQQGFEKLGQEVKQSKSQMVEKEQEAYEFDHTLIGLTLLESWNIDSRISQAVLNHHSDLSGENSNELAALIAVADYVCFKAGLGFLAEPPLPSMAWLQRCLCADEAAMDETVAEVRQAYFEESAIFKLV